MMTDFNAVLQTNEFMATSASHVRDVIDRGSVLIDANDDENASQHIRSGREHDAVVWEPGED